MTLAPALLLLAAAAAGAPASGEYRSLKLAFADGRVTGAFREERMGAGTPSAPQFSCAFALTGAWRGGDGSTEVLTWWPGEDPADQRIAGRLTVRGGAATLKLVDDPGGCAMTGEAFAGEGYSEALSARRPWLEVREVRSRRAAFRASPGGPSGRAYVTRGDTVGVLARAGAFARVQYVDGRRPMEGWLPLTDLQPGQPRRGR